MIREYAIIVAGHVGSLHASSAVAHVDADPSGQPPDRDTAENASVADPMMSTSAPTAAT
jgi:hypothetical protein